MTQNGTQASDCQDDLEAMAAQLEASGAYRVARRLDLSRHLHADAGEPTRLGLVLDVETTGLDPRADEIIELAMLPFLYTETGRITAVLQPFSRLRQPAVAIPARVTQITGITDASVAGQAIDPAEVADIVAPATLIVAHNASFDRRFAERFCDAFSGACSLTQVDWQAAGHEGTKLAYLLAGSGFFSTRHRALDDCQAALALLARELPGTGLPALATLLHAAHQSTIRISAAGAPFAAKDLLKVRGYRWQNGEDGRSRGWVIDVTPPQRGAELAFLRASVFPADHCPPETLVTAADRFSDRI